MLQRLAENFQYAELLNSATKEKNQYKRLAYITAFNLSSFAFNTFRTLKSFNPILGETFEYIDNDLGFRYFSEQVSHHPPISACYVEGLNYDVYSNTHVDTKFSLFKGALFITPNSKTYINIKNLKESYTYTKPKLAVKGLIFGKMRIDCYGKFEVTNRTTNDIATVEFLEEGGKTKQGTIKGEIKNINGDVELLLDGNWQSHFDIIYPKTDDQEEKRETIWRRMMDENCDDEKHFYFTRYVANLNNLSDELRKVLPQTDCRFRQDQRALEDQDYDLAESEKKRLEVKQREARKLREKENKTYEAVYFKEVTDDISGDLLYMQSRDYWNDRKLGKFTLSNDIFGKEKEVINEENKEVIKEDTKEDAKEDVNKDVNKEQTKDS